MDGKESMNHIKITAEDLALQVDILLNTNNGDIFDYEETENNEGETYFEIRQPFNLFYQFKPTDLINWYQDGLIVVDGVTFKTGTFNSVLPHIKKD